MLSLDPLVIGFLAVVANILVQAVKGLLPEKAKALLPVGIMAVMAGCGALLAWYTGRDPVSGGLEGFFAGASSVGLYELASNVPGLSRVFSSAGWIGRG